MADEQDLMNPLQQVSEEETAPPTVDPRLQAALEQRDKQRQMADLLGGFQKIIGASAAGTGYKTDTSMADTLRKRAEDPMKLYKEQVASQAAAKKEKRETSLHEQKMAKIEQDLKAGKIKIDDDEANKTPGSDVSKTAVTYYNELRRQNGEVVSPEEEEAMMQNMTAKEITTRVPHVQKMVVDVVKHRQAIELAKVKKQDKSQETMTPYQKRSLELREEEVKRKQKGEARRGKKFEHDVEEKDELSDKQTEQMISLDDGLTLANRMSEIYPDVKDDLGLYASNLEQSKRYIPFTERDPKFVEMQQIVGSELADYVKTISGAAVSEEEAQRLKKNIPTMDDKPGEFKVKLDTFMSLLNEYKANKIKGFRQQGKDPSGFEKKEVAPEAKTVVRKGYNAKTNQTQLIYSDGSKEIVEGKQ